MRSKPSTTYGLGYPVLVIDEAGKKRQSWVDGFGRTIEVDEPESSGNLTSATCYAYDVLGNLTQVVHGAQTRTYGYDSLSRILRATTPESGVTTFFYTTSSGALCSGNPRALCRRTDARGITTTYSYDALNRLTSKSYSDSTPAVQYGYDGVALTGCTTAPPALTITNPKGRRTAMCDGSGAAAWSYDAAGNVLTEARTIAGITRTISYSYNLDSSLASLTYPSGRRVNYTVGNAERVTAAADADGTQYAYGVSYAATGAVGSLIYGRIAGGFAGITETHGYNNRLEYTGTQASSSAGTAVNLGFNFSLPGGNNGSVASETNNLDNSRTQNYVYDALNRISSAATVGTSGAQCWGQNFVPDAVANLTGMSVSQCTAGTLSVTVNGNNQITNTGFSYDAAGNMTQDGSGYTYSFDAENRITSAAGVNYTYDGNSLRVKKSSGTLYWRSITGEAIAETDLSGNTASEYVFVAGRRIVRRDGSGNVYYLFADHLGTTRTITRADGTVCYDGDFTPYGQEIYKGTDTCPQNYKFTGYERDAETGLDYAFARYYNPRLGRFMSPDPLGGDISDPQSLNLYAYVGNNPLNFTDPLGLFKYACLNDEGICGWGGGPPVGLFFWVYDPFFSGTCTPEGCSSGGYYPVFWWPVQRGGGGGGGGPIGSALRKLSGLLNQDPACLAFLNSNKDDAEKKLNDILQYGLYGQAEIPPVRNPDGTTTITNAVSGGYVEGQAITVNTIGAFFKSSYGGLALTTDRGKIRGGTEPARLFIALHELGHLTGVLQPDRANQKMVDQNDKTLERKCKDTIKAFGK